MATRQVMAYSPEPTRAIRPYPRSLVWRNVGSARLGNRYSAGGIDMHSGPSNTVGAVCGPEGNVHDNLPYDCTPAP